MSDRVKRLLSRTALLIKSLLAILMIYLAINLIGLWPVNNEFQPAKEGIEILVVSNDVHADIVMPLETDAIDWRTEFPQSCFEKDTSGATHVSVGWGDKGFFLETPTWADLRYSVAARAMLWPSETCMHVELTRRERLSATARSVRISPAQYKQLVEFVRSSFVRDASGNVMQVADASYSGSDAFFEAHGNYHCFNTCNCWTGRALRVAGVRVGWMTAMPRTVYQYLPAEAVDDPAEEVPQDAKLDKVTDPPETSPIAKQSASSQ